MKKLLVLIISLSFLGSAYAQYPDLEAQKALWRQMVADTAQAAVAVPHAEFHASLGVSAFTTLGHGSRGGGFGQDISLSYEAPLTHNGKCWLTVGGYLSHTLYRGDSYRDAGLYAMLDYRFNEHWEGYAFAQISGGERSWWRSPRYWWGTPYGLGRWTAPYSWRPMAWGDGMALGGVTIPGADMVGVGTTYHFNHHFSIGFSVSQAWYRQGW